MLLQRLVEYAAEHGDGPPFHRQLEFAWQLELDLSGAPRSVELTSLLQAQDKGRPRGVTHLAPSAVRTVGVAANLAADDVQYVLGWPDPDSGADRVAQCHDHFVELTRRWADSPAGATDPVAQAVWAFYRDGHLTTIRRPDGITTKDRVLITVDGAPALRAPSAAPFWTAEVAARKGGTRQGLCLVCGLPGPLLDTVPGKVPSRLVPGASNDAALVSVNEDVFGYGLTTKLGSTPLCMTCGDAITTGLREVLDSSGSMSYPGQDSRVAWWIAGGAEVDAMAMLDCPDPAQVTALIGSVHTGRPTGIEDTTRFCSLTVGGNVARVMVRDWIEMPLDQLHRNVAAWFEDLRMVRLWPTEPEFVRLTQLIHCTGRWLRREKGYARFTAKGADRPESVHRDLLRAAMRGTPLPPALLAHIVNRVRTDGRLDTARAALLRLALIRLPHPGEPPMPRLDREHTDPSYLAGRVFAVLDSLQHAASGGQLNATYSDRHFAGAVTNPRAAIVSGRRTATAWLRKLRRTKPGLAVDFDRRLTGIFDLIDAQAGVPSRTTVRQQAQFLLGYHHQRADQFAARPTTDTNPGDPA
ncbi:MAG TPA: type I-C CRISPR-associated protein Cas8c/Csd1 [Pseudonocardiaceae bacterium]